MCAGEVACVVLAGVLLGLSAGAASAVLVAWLTRRKFDRTTARAELHARWLAARLTVTRVSLSFIAAFRVLKAEQRESSYFTLRIEEAQRARGDWCAAMQKLESAQAAIITHGLIDPKEDAYVGPRPVSAESLRKAIDGGDREVAELVQCLRDADRTAVDFARSSSTRRGSTRWFDYCCRMFAEALALVESIVNRWSRPD
jgi:hypothetical protein